jgi:serine/threonine protein kinase
MELALGEQLFDRIVKQQLYRERDARAVVRTLLEAVGYLHVNGVAHRYNLFVPPPNTQDAQYTRICATLTACCSDLKPENVIVYKQVRLRVGLLPCKPDGVRAGFIAVEDCRLWFCCI